MENKVFYTAKEASEFLQINEKKLYVLAASGHIPATKITGKWLFPANELKQFLIRDALSQCPDNITPLLDQGFMLFAGSDDPILNRIFHAFHAEHPQLEIYYSCVGSFRGLELLGRHQCHVAFAHIYHQDTDEFNFYYADQYLAKDSYVIINLFRRDIGFVSRQPICSFQEVRDKELIFVNRQPQSGIRNLTEQMLHSEQLKDSNIKIFKQEMLTHFDVAQTVSQHENTVGIASQLTASQFDLHFHKLMEERFDLITYKESSLHENLVRFVNHLKNSIPSQFSDVQGYHFEATGQTMIRGEKR
jgi:excisionase family DNA binding protein